MQKLINVGGGEVWAEDTGGDLPPVVLLHPGTGDSRIWNPIWERLTGRYRLIRYDARGFGRDPLVVDLLRSSVRFWLGSGGKLRAPAAVTRELDALKPPGYPGIGHTG